MEYIIVMKFLSWVFAWMLLMGYGIILQCENELCREKPKTDDMVRLGMQRIVDEYNGRNWAGRVMLVMYWGATVMAIPWMIFQRREK
jgi:hypothetical protein